MSFEKLLRFDLRSLILRGVPAPRDDCADLLRSSFSRIRSSLDFNRPPPLPDHTPAKTTLSAVFTDDSLKSEVPHSYSSACESFAFFRAAHKEFLINNRHENADLQKEYDKQFGLIKRP